MAGKQYWQLLLVVSLCGCRSSDAIRMGAVPAIKLSRVPLSMPPAESEEPEMSPEALDASPAEPIQLASQEIFSQEDTIVAENEEPPSPTASSGAHSLVEAVSIALAQNPDLIALRQTEQVGVAAYGVAATYPFNPFLQVQATPYQDAAARGPGTTSHYVLLMQRIQLAHQQQHREDAAFSSLNGVRWNIHQAELQAVSLTAQFYFAVLYQRGLLEVARASQENNAQLFEVLSKRFEAGDAAAADVATVRVDLLSTRQQLQMADANYQSALRNLRRQIGMPIDSPYEFEGDIRQIRWQLPHRDAMTRDLNIELSQQVSAAKDWVAGWVTSRPDVLAAQANIDVARANLRLATADRVPDVQIGPYYQADPDGMSRFGFRAEMNLLVVNSGKPLENQRIAELRQQTTIWQQTLVRAELEAQAAYERYEFAYRNLEQAASSFTEELPLELQSLERQFRQGEVDVVRVIQARTSILQNQRAHLDLLNEVAQSAGLLIGASGIPLETLVSQ